MKSNYNKIPSVKVEGSVLKGWEAIILELFSTSAKVIALECYVGVNFHEIASGLDSVFSIDTRTLLKAEGEVCEMTHADVSDDAIFGFISRLRMADFMDADKLAKAKEQVSASRVPVIVYGPGALLVVPDAKVKVYADMARWEIQMRMRKQAVHGLGVDDSKEPVNIQYKRGYFVDWRVCDKFKQEHFEACDYLLDTNKADCPKLLKMEVVKDGLHSAATQPFRVVPFFDPGVWGGHWMEEVCGIDREGKSNHAWCFDCVPEENSLLLKVGGDTIELPSINVVLFQSQKLLGDEVEGRFGKEFPIRFDLLDTMGGGNLSLQVHPDTTYIQQNFGLNYTQDESYYMLDVADDAEVFLGLKKNIDSDLMIQELNKAQEGGQTFEATKFVNSFPAKKHDHFLIPAGTVHCSGKNSMVLEISATSYIFTFKIWDWDRLDLDGRPRPINIDHASKVIDWSRDTDFAKNELINQVEKVSEGDGWVEERTGLHRREFIETRRHWFTKPVTHNTHGGVNVLNLVEGREAIVESPTRAFDPYVVHYAETFIIPAAIGEYTISPFGESVGQKIGTLKAYVRTQADY